MGKHKLHLHSMMVHIVAALAPIAAVAYIFLKRQVAFFYFDDKTWSFIVIGSIIIMFLGAIPSIISGVFERGHKYAKWHSTHKIKLIYSLLLAMALIAELFALANKGLEQPMISLFGFLVILANNYIVFILSKYGLKITLGCQSLAKTSYEPDLFKKEPVDILEKAGRLSKEEPKYYDILTEH